MAETTLYWISATQDSGDDASLMVEAYTPDHAVYLWGQWLKENGFDCDGDDMKVFQVPALSGQPKVREFFQDVKDVTP